jgi:hypothetical protein
VSNIQDFIDRGFYIFILYKKITFIITLLILGFLLFISFDSEQKDTVDDLDTLSYKEYVAHVQSYKNKLLKMSKENKIDYRELDMFLRNGIDINTADKDGKTPLFYAAINNNEYFFEYLLRNGSDMYKKDNSGKEVVEYIDKKSRNYIKLILFKVIQKAKASGIQNPSVTINSDNYGNIISIQINGKEQKNYLDSL